jgi:hypothetical protein
MPSEIKVDSPNGAIAFGISSVKGRIRRPLPAAITSACFISVSFFN